MGWRAVIVKFQKHLEQEQGLHSVKDLCDGLLHRFGLGSDEEVLAYVKDYLAVSRAHLGFHTKWMKIPNMLNVAEHDKKEIAEVQKLIQMLS